MQTYLLALVQARQGGQKIPQQQLPQLEPHPQTLCFHPGGPCCPWWMLTTVMVLPIHFIFIRLEDTLATWLENFHYKST